MLCTNRKHARLSAPPESSAIPISNCIGCQLEILRNLIDCIETELVQAQDRILVLEGRLTYGDRI